MRKKLTLLIFIFTCIFSIAKAQNWGGGIDDEQFNFGFGFQYISSEYKLVKNINWRAPYFDNSLGTNTYVTDSLASIASPTSVGFGIGFVFNTSIKRNLDFRFTPTLVFNDRLINYNYVVPGTYNPTQPVIQKKVQATMIDFPIGLKLKSDRLTNFRAYVIGGLKYSVDLASKKKNDDTNAAPIDKVIKNKQSFLSYEAGVGFDIYFEYFKMSPEVKMSYSLKDIFIHEVQPYSSPIDKAKLRHFTFSLFFE